MAAPDPSNRRPQTEQPKSNPSESTGAGDPADPDQALDQVRVLSPEDDPDATMAYRPAAPGGGRAGRRQKPRASTIASAI